MASNARWLAKDLVQGTIKKANSVVGSTDAHLLRKNIAAINITADSEKSGQVSAHVEDGCRGSIDLTDRRNPSARKILRASVTATTIQVRASLTAVVRQCVKTRTRPTLVGWTRRLERIICCKLLAAYPSSI